MTALTLYAYCIGVRSSRAIERACRVDVAFRVITANQVPDHTTIARFRQRHEQALASVFTESLRLCAQAGMVKVGLVAVDGTRMGCPAALAANRTKSHIDEQVATMMAEAAAVDAREDVLFGASSSGEEPPAQLHGARARREWFAAAKAQADHERHLAERAAKEEASGRKLRGRKPKPPPPEADAKANISDPDSRIMKTKDGYVQGYNAQAVATEDQIVVAVEVTDEHNDQAQLHPMIAATNQSLVDAGIDDDIARLLADAGYCSEDNLAALTGQDPDCFIATRNTRRNSRRNSEPRCGRRGPLPAEATLVDKMDRKVSEKARAGGLPEATTHHRARVRPDQGRPGSQTIHAPRQERRAERVETADGHPQPAQALPPDPHRPAPDPPGTMSLGPGHRLRVPPAGRWSGPRRQVDSPQASHRLHIPPRMPSPTPPGEARLTFRNALLGGAGCWPAQPGADDTKPEPTTTTTNAEKPSSNNDHDLRLYYWSAPSL